MERDHMIGKLMHIKASEYRAPRDRGTCPLYESGRFLKVKSYKYIGVSERTSFQ